MLQRVRAAAKAAALSVLIGTLLNMSAVGSAGAAKLVNAYVVQLLLLLTPLVCALCNTLILRQPSPPKLLLAVLLSLAGGGMVVGGYWLQEQQQAAGSKAAKAVEAKSLVLGVAVALLAMLGQALYFVMVQLTRNLCQRNRWERLAGSLCCVCLHGVFACSYGSLRVWRIAASMLCSLQQRLGNCEIPHGIRCREFLLKLFAAPIHQHCCKPLRMQYWHDAQSICAITVPAGAMGQPQRSVCGGAAAGPCC
jgi:hypothetical protein